MAVLLMVADFCLVTGVRFAVGFLGTDLTACTEVVRGWMLMTLGFGWGAGGFFRGVDAPCTMVAFVLIGNGSGARYGFGAMVFLMIFGGFFEQALPMALLSAAMVGDGSVRGAVNFLRFFCCDLPKPSTHCDCRKKNRRNTENSWRKTENNRNAKKLIKIKVYNYTYGTCPLNYHRNSNINNTPRQNGPENMHSIRRYKTKDLTCSDCWIFRTNGLQSFWAIIAA